MENESRMEILASSLDKNVFIVDKKYKDEIINSSLDNEIKKKIINNAKAFRDNNLKKEDERSL